MLLIETRAIIFEKLKYWEGLGWKLFLDLMDERIGAEEMLKDDRTELYKELRNELIRNFVIFLRWHQISLEDDEQKKQIDKIIEKMIKCFI